MWEKTGVITKLLSDRKYEVMMDGSHHITTRNRRHLRRIPGKKVELEEDEEEKEQERVPMSRKVPVPVPGPAVPVPAGPVPAVPGPAEDKVPAPAEVPVPGEAQDEPRRSGRSRSGPDRLVVTGQGKSYAAVVQEKPVKAVKPLGKGGCVCIVYTSDLVAKKCHRSSGGSRYSN